MKIKFDDSFNWGAVLKDLAAGATIDADNHSRIMLRASLWPTCACGQLCSALPRITNPGAIGYGGPVDITLFHLGCDFHMFVKSSDWKMALACFHKIEARTMELLEAQDEPSK